MYFVSLKSLRAHREFISKSRGEKKKGNYHIIRIQYVVSVVREITVYFIDKGKKDLPKIVTENA